MSFARSVFLGLVHFWMTPIRAEPLALFRILVGGSAVVMALASYLPRLAGDVGPEGACPLGLLDSWLDRTHRFCLLRGPQNIPVVEGWFLPEARTAWRDWADSPSGAFTLFGIWTLSLVGLTSGFCTRLCAIAAWALTTSFQLRLSWTLNGGDAVYRNALFYLMFAPAGATWSVDAWLRRRWGWGAREEPVVIPPWSVRLLQIHVCYVYLFTGLWKLWDGDWGEDWLNGEAVYWMLNDLAISRWSYLDVPIPMLFCRLGSWGTLIFELGFPVAVLFRRLRYWWLAVGLALHIGIFLTIDVGWFSQAILCWYALFLSGERCAALRAWLLGLWSHRKSCTAVQSREPECQPARLSAT